jgi:TorA maturation chaperone TorD
MTATTTMTRNRAALYGLLSEIFRRPLRSDQLARLRSPEMLAAMSAAGIAPGEEFINSDTDVLLDQLAIDFTQLFHGPEERISPYECIHRGDGSELMGAEAAEVCQFMAEVGFSVSPESGELPDHISVELAFMGELAGREASAIEAGDLETSEFAASVQRRFLDAHLGRWAVRFARKVKDRAQTPFYAAMADLLASFCADERDAEAA